MNTHSLARTTPLSRASLIERILVGRRPVAQAAADFGISERTAYKWLARFRSGGADALRDRPSRPSCSPNRTAEDRERLVCELRRRRLTGPQIAQALRMAPATVARILKRAGLNRLKYLEPPEPPNRYEHKRPGDLLHLDVKKLGRIGGRVGHRIHGDRTKRVRGAGWEYVHVCVDDASRLAYVEVLDDELGATTAAFLERALAWYRRHGIRVRRILSDNGGNYRSIHFRRVCQHWSIRHSYTRPYRPRTNGKAERFIQTLLREWAYRRPYKYSYLRVRALRPWLRYYNQSRPHGSLHGRPPISRLRRSPEQRA